MTVDNQYIKDVEKYFISLAGEGIMLSSQDYALISELRRREVPKEVVLRGINRAFSKLAEQDASSRSKIKSVTQCYSFIEKSIDEFSPVKERKISEQTSKGPSGIIGEATEKLSGFINDEKSANIRDYYIKLRNKILSIENAEEENTLGSIITIEAHCLEEFFSALPEEEKESITRDAEEMVKGRGRYMTDKAFSESVISFRNEIIHNKYGVRYLFSYD